GRMEAGESAEECARREVREELGVTVAGLGHVETQVLAGTRWRLAVYASEEFTGEIEPSAEILEYRWTRLTEVAQVDGTPGLAEVARRALGVVGSVRRARDSQPPTPDLSPR